MKSELKVCDLMREEITTIHLDASIREAVEELSRLEQQTAAGAIPEAQSLLVVDEEGNLQGLIAMLDILVGIEPSFLRESEHLAQLSWDGLFEEMIAQAEKRTVAEAMTPVKQLEVVEPDDRLATVIELMVRERQRRLPVVDEEGKVVGMVRLYDVFHEVARVMLGGSGGGR